MGILIFIEIFYLIPISFFICTTVKLVRSISQFLTTDANLEPSSN